MSKGVVRSWKRCTHCGRGYAGADGLSPACRAMLARQSSGAVQPKRVSKRGFPRGSGAVVGTT